MGNIKYYPFELHTHTYHSDGSFSPRGLLDAAEKEGLAGVAITDHNADTAFRELAEEKLVVIKGIEWTTFYGHITVLGVTDAVDWIDVNPQNILQKAAAVRAAGGLIGIAHPYRVGFPVCTGGTDDWGIEDYSSFTHYEVWSETPLRANPTNVEAENRYLTLVQKGQRLACVYGRDWHREYKGLHAATYLGIKGEPNAENALEAIRDGRTYVSAGVELNVTLIAEDGTEFTFGAEVPAGKYRLHATSAIGNRALAEEYGIVPREVFLRGSALLVNLNCELNEGKADFTLELESGFLQVVILGKIDGVQDEIALATPFYIGG